MPLASSYLNDGTRPSTASHGASVFKNTLSLIRTATPIAAVGLVNLAMAITDAVMMANLDPRALAAGVVVGDIYSIFIQFAAGALSAYTPRVAAACGKRDQGLAGLIVGEGVRTAFMLGIGGAILIALIPSGLLMAGMALPLPDAARAYASYMAGAFPFMMIVVLARNVFPALECSSLPVYVLSAAVPLNGFLNAALMYGWFGFPAMGLPGAGASSMTVTAFMAILFAVYACFSHRFKDFALAHYSAGRSWIPKFVAPREIFLVGAVALCETGVFLISTMMIGFLDMEAVAAHVAVFRMVAISYAISTGIGQAITIHAAKEESGSAHMRTLERSALLLSFAGGPILMALVLIVPEAIFDVTGMDGRRIPAISLFAGISVFAIVPALAIRGFLRASSDSFAPAIIGVAGYWGIGFPAMLLFAALAGLGASGVWAGLALGTAATSVALVIYYSRRKYRERIAGRGEMPWLSTMVAVGD